DEYQARSRMAGVDHHLVKPIDLDAVVNLLAERRAGGTDAPVRAAGAGLGLAIVERVARLHGGTLELVAREGGGTIARVTLARRAV
ncbi:MAG: ATP-binding protein, partial [Vicinamibacteria bacterium]